MARKGKRPLSLRLLAGKTKARAKLFGQNECMIVRVISVLVWTAAYCFSSCDRLRLALCAPRYL